MIQNYKEGELKRDLFHKDVKFHHGSKFIENKIPN